MRARPVDRILRRLDSLFDGERDLPRVVDDVGRLSTQLVLQTVLDAEVALHLGRDVGAQRTVGTSGPASGVRSGHRVVAVKTTAGPVEIWWPRLRDGSGGFVSKFYRSQTVDVHPLSALLVAAHVRRLSSTEVGDALTQAFQEPADAVPPTSFAEISDRVVQECEAWGRRRLDGRDIHSLVMGAGSFSTADGTPADPVLVVGGVMEDGRPTFIGLAPGAAESVEAWASLLADLAKRGLRAPVSFPHPVPSALVTALARGFFAPAS